MYCLLESLAASLNPHNDHWRLRDEAANILAAQRDAATQRKFAKTVKRVTAKHAKTAWGDAATRRKPSKAADEDTAT